MVSKRVTFGAILFLVSANFLYFGGVLIKQLFHSRLLDITISYPTRAHGIIVNYLPSLRRGLAIMVYEALYHALQTW